MSAVDVTWREVEARTVTRGPGAVDPWFLGRYGMNLYRGCQHGCAYCDGRAERYFVPGDFAREISVKRNALEVLARELAKLKEPGFLFLGGGVCDAYQPAEEHYRLARGALELAVQLRLPVHVLTKSALVERDLDLLEQVGRQTRAVLSFSVQSLAEDVREVFEPGAAPVAERLRLLKEAKRRGLSTGLMAMPVLPGISDQPQHVNALVQAAADAGVDFICHGGLTLRPGVQKRTYLDVLRQHRPELLDGYAKAYRVEKPSGAPDARYLARVDARFRSALAAHAVPGRIPRRIFTGLIPLYAELAVLLEHLDYQRGTRVLGASGWAVQQWARAEVAQQGRKRGFSYREVEADFRARVHTGDIQQLPGFAPAALEPLRQLLQSST